MSNRWISDLVGTFKTTFRIGKAVIDTSATGTGTPTVLGTTNTGIKIPDTDGLCWMGQTGLKISRTATDVLRIVGGSNGFELQTGGQPNNHFNSLVDTVSGFRITGGTGTNTTPTYTWNGNNVGTGLFLKVATASGPTKIGIVTQPASTTTGRHVVDVSLGRVDILHGSADTVPPLLDFQKSRGTSNSPTVITTGDLLAQITGSGYGGNSFGNVTAVKIEMVSQGTIADTGTGVGGILKFFTRAVGGALTEYFSLDQAGLATFVKRCKALIFTATPQTVTFSATPAIDVSLGDPIDITLTGNVTGATMSGGVDGQKITLRIRQDGTGSRTWAFGGSNVRFGTDLPSITLTTTASKTDYLGMIYHSSDNKYDVVAFTKGF